MAAQPSQDLSTYKIFADGNELPGTLNVLSILIDKGINKIPMARILFKDGDPSAQDFAASNRSELDPGKTIRIEGGFHNQNDTLFEGMIIKQSIRLKNATDSFLVIECKDKAYKMTLARKSKYFADAKDSDAADTIAGTYGLQKEIDPTSVSHRQLVQYGCTDWDFIVSRMEFNGMVVLAENGTLKCKKPTVGSATVTASFGTDVLSFDGLLDATHQYETVTCKAWSLADQDLATSDNESVSLTEGGDLSAAALAGKVNASHIEFSHSGKLSMEELKGWATSVKTKNLLSKIRGTVTCKGKLDAKPLGTITLAGFGAHYNGDYFISGVRNELRDNVWETTIQFGWWPQFFTEQYEVQDKPAAGLIAPVNGLQIGVVTKLENDPESEFRIQVKFPAMDNTGDGIWARVGLLDAGNERGSFFMPEVGDEVIAGFINDDPRDAVVLGMLNSSGKPAPFTPADANNEKGFVTRSKMKIVFDDDKKVLTIRTPGEREVILDDKQELITIRDKNKNKIEMSADGIVIESGKDLKLKATGDFKAEGVNVEMKGTSNFKAEGSGGAKLSSSAVTEVKGSMVNIN